MLVAHCDHRSLLKSSAPQISTDFRSFAWLRTLQKVVHHACTQLSIEIEAHSRWRSALGGDTSVRKIAATMRRELILHATPSNPAFFARTAASVYSLTSARGSGCALSGLTYGASPNALNLCLNSFPNQKKHFGEPQSHKKGKNTLHPSPRWEKAPRRVPPASAEACRDARRGRRARVERRSILPLRGWRR